MENYSKRHTFFLQSSMVLLLSSLTALPLNADIVFDFHGNHVLYGKAQAELHLKDNYTFGSKITPNNFILLKFSSSVGRFTIHQKEILTIFAGLDITGELTQFTGDYQFYLDATGSKFLSVRRDGTWKFDYDKIGGTYGKWSLRKKGFRNVCLKQDNFQNAVIRGDMPYVKQCIESGYPINYKTAKGWTGLHTALHHGKLNIVKYLLKHGAKSTIKDELGHTPLDYATQAKKYDMIAVLDRGR